MSDKISVENVYREYSKMIYKYLLSKVHNENIAEEITQETFYRAVTAADKFDYSCKVSTWICSIAKNTYFEYIRKNPQNEELKDDFINQFNLEESYIEVESRLNILSAIHTMPEPAREILYLRLFSDLSFREIGKIMDKSEEWARVTYYRAKLKLRKEIENNEWN